MNTASERKSWKKPEDQTKHLTYKGQRIGITLKKKKKKQWRTDKDFFTQTKIEGTCYH
jgi:hypothetical protein